MSKSERVTKLRVYVPLRYVAKSFGRSLEVIAAGTEPEVTAMFIAVVHHLGYSHAEIRKELGIGYRKWRQYTNALNSIEERRARAWAGSVAKQWTREQAEAIGLYLDATAQAISRAARGMPGADERSEGRD